MPYIRQMGYLFQPMKEYINVYFCDASFFLLLLARSNFDHLHQLDLHYCWLTRRILLALITNKRQTLAT